VAGGSAGGEASTAARRLRRGLALAVAVLALVLLLRAFILQAFWIPSASMEPTLAPGDRILVSKLATRFSDVGRGDVIVFDDPRPEPDAEGDAVSAFLRWLLSGLGAAKPAGRDFVKRVIALPGESWEMRRGILYVDGRPVDEPYLDPTVDARSFGPATVPPGRLFVLGDNRADSSDSRFSQLGYVPRDKVVGRAVAVIWPPSRMGWL
jgi:signal peptidase I